MISGRTQDLARTIEAIEAVDARRADQIVVYKIDRLARSLADFANGPSGWKRHKAPSCRSPSPSTPPQAWGG